MAETTTRPTPPTTLDPDSVRKIDRYWRACNYLSVGMIYLRANPLLREPLKPEHFKHRLLGHWGSDPGQSFTWIHLNRLIRKYDLDVIYISGPGHGAPASLFSSSRASSSRSPPLATRCPARADYVTLIDDAQHPDPRSERRRPRV